MRLGQEDGQEGTWIHRTGERGRGVLEIEPHLARVATKLGRSSGKVMVSAIVLGREKPVCAVGHQVARDSQRKAGSIREHDGPFHDSQSDDFGRTVGGGNGAPVLIDGFSDKVVGTECDGKRTTSVENHGYRERVGVVALGSETSDKMGVKSRSGRLEALGMK